MSCLRETIVSVGSEYFTIDLTHDKICIKRKDSEAIVFIYIVNDLIVAFSDGLEDLWTNKKIMGFLMLINQVEIN